MLSITATIISKEADIYAFLRARFEGLRVEHLAVVVQKGVAARLSCTAYDAPNAPGMQSYFAQVRTFRELLCVEGWEADDSGNFCTVVSKSREEAIAVAAGCSATGRAERTPSTQYPHGPALQEAVDLNQLSLPLPGYESTAAKTQPRRTWLLLTHVTSGGEVRSELSLPRTITDAGYVVDWGHRIILPTFTTTPAPELERGDDAENAPASIDIEVRRKA